MTVTFHVVEKESMDHLFEPFLEDYKAGHSITELRKKYCVSNSVWREWREWMKDSLRNEGGNRPKKPKQLKKFLDDYWITQNKRKDTATVFRRYNNSRYSYGTYPSMKCAEMVCEQLLEYEWDKFVAYDLLQTYGIPNSKRILSSRLMRRDF